MIYWYKLIKFEKWKMWKPYLLNFFISLFILVQFRFSIFANISIDKSRKYEIELFRDWRARIDLSRPRNRPRVPSLVDISQVYFELRPSLISVHGLKW